MNFLNSTTLQKLETSYKNEQDANVKLRLLTCIYRKENKSFREISGALRMPTTVVYRWINRFERQGIKGLYRKQGSGGHNRYLTKQQERGLARKLDHTPMPTREVIVYIKETYGKQYHPNSIPRLLRRLDQSLITGRPRHEDADPEKERAFKRDIKKDS